MCSTSHGIRNLTCKSHQQQHYGPYVQTPLAVELWTLGASAIKCGILDRTCNFLKLCSYGPYRQIPQAVELWTIYANPTSFRILDLIPKLWNYKPYEQIPQAVEFWTLRANPQAEELWTLCAGCMLGVNGHLCLDAGPPDKCIR